VRNETEAEGFGGGRPTKAVTGKLENTGKRRDGMGIHRGEVRNTVRPCMGSMMDGGNLEGRLVRLEQHRGRRTCFWEKKKRKGGGGFACNSSLLDGRKGVYGPGKKGE